MPKKKKIKCVYCGVKDATTRDHVPPRSFYAPPLTSDLITVPSCFVCNNTFGKDDEYIRNIFISLDTTEHIPGLWQLRKSMWDSFARTQSQGLIYKIYNNIRPIAITTPAGIFLGNSPAFDFNSREFNNFFERIARALLHKETDCGYVNCNVLWKVSSNVDTRGLSPHLILFLKSGFYRSIGNGQFKYVAYYHPNKIGSMFIIRFYDVIEFMLLVKGL